jgi:arylsulfatase A-like enzyme
MRGASVTSPGWAKSFLLALLVGCGETSNPEPGTPQNLLLVTFDTTRADHLGCYGGNARVSPRIDALAAEGVVVERAYTPVPYTLPAHTTLMTGNPPFVHSVRTNGLFRVPEEALTLAEHLETQGYQTAAFPSADVLYREHGLDQGFQVYEDDLGQGAELTLPMRAAPETTKRVTAWIREQLAEPFFLWVHYFDPHTPYEEPADLRGQFDSAYEAEIHLADRNLGVLLDELDGRGILPRTWVCFTADHGESLGEHQEDTHGYFLYEATVRVPLILQHPSLAPLRLEHPWSLEDVAPTLLELLRLPVFPCTGRSRSASVRGGPQSQDPLYLETYVTYLSFAWSPMEAVIDGHWKYIRAPEPELYDLRSDPAESRNLYSEQDAEVARLQGELQRLQTSSEPRLEQQLAELDAEAARRLELLGYITTAGSTLATEELPEPGEEAGPDPKHRLEVLPYIYQLFVAGSHDQSSKIIGLCEQILQRDPDNPMAYQYLGTELVRQGRYREALHPLTTMDSLGRATPKALLTLGLAQLHTADLESAAETLQRSLNQAPHDPRTLRWLGEVEERRNRPEHALTLYRKLVENFRGPDEALLQIEKKIESLEQKLQTEGS